VHGADGERGAAHPDAALLEIQLAALAGELVQQVAIDVQQLHAVAELVDDVQVPDFVEEGACHSYSMRMFACFTTGPQRSRSARICAPNSSGELPTGSMPSTA